MTSNKFVKFASFGTTGSAERTTLATIKNATTGAIAKLKRFINGQAVATTTAQPTAKVVAVPDEQNEEYR